MLEVSSSNPHRRKSTLTVVTGLEIVPAILTVNYQTASPITYRRRYYRLPRTNCVPLARNHFSGPSSGRAGNVGACRYSVGSIRNVLSTRAAARRSENL
jgi:hypothetical protein